MLLLYISFGGGDVLTHGVRDDVVALRGSLRDLRSGKAYSIYWSIIVPLRMITAPVC